jgi:glycosyltransferase involved in cell wall biosynthesis
MDGRESRGLHVLEVLGNGIVGGMETYVARLTRHLKFSGVKVSALCPFEGPLTAALRAEGCPILIAPVTDDPTWSTVQSTATYVLAEQVDVMHAHLGNAHVLAALISAVTAVPCVATIHGRSIPMLDLEAHRLLDGPCMTVVCHSAYNHARALGVLPHRLKLIANGVPAAPSRTRIDELHRLLGLAPATPILGFVGRLAPEKGPELFVRMAWMLRRKHPDVHYVFIGDGPLRGALIKEASELGLLDRMHFVGVRDDVQLLLPSLSLLIMPSQSEGMPLALMEAMAAGVPAVATSVGGIPEIVAHTITGLVLAPNDLTKLSAAVGELLDDPNRRKAMGEASRARADLWSVETASREMASYLGQVVENLHSRRTYVPCAPHARIQDERP